MTDVTITEIPLEQLRESPFNERKTFDQVALASLAENIKSEGIIEPLLVRPIWANQLRVDLEPPSWYEIVVGHRRNRAAAIAGLATAPCMVQRMDEEEAKRKQVSENLQRENVHALEEAAALESLRVDHGLSVADLVTRTGKSESYVRGRLRLLTLVPAVREAFAAGDIGGEIALLFARQEPHLQEKALARLQSSQHWGAKRAYENGGKDGYRTVRDFLNEYFMFDLKDALWKLDDAELLPSAGACTTCPKRSGCTPQLFADVVFVAEKRTANNYDEWDAELNTNGPNVCTDPDCFDDKKKAHLKREQVALEAKGKTVIAGAKARQVVDTGGNVKAGYVEASKVRDLIKKAKADVTVSTVQLSTGKTREVVKVADLVAAGLKTAEPKPEKSGATHRVNDEAERKKREARAELQTTINRTLLERVRAAQDLDNPGEFELRRLAAWCAGNVSFGDDEAELYTVTSEPNGLKGLQHRAATADLRKVTRLILDCMLVEGVEIGQWDRDPKVPQPLLDAAKHYGIDVDAVKADVKACAAEPVPAAPTKAKAKGKKAAAAEAAPIDVKDGSTLHPAMAWPFPKSQGAHFKPADHAEALEAEG